MVGAGLAAGQDLPTAEQVVAVHEDGGGPTDRLEHGQRAAAHTGAAEQLDRLGATVAEDRDLAADAPAGAAHLQASIGDAIEWVRVVVGEYVHAVGY